MSELLAEDAPTSNRAAVLVGPGTINVRDLPLPSAPSPGHVLVNVVSSGICGSDLHRFQLGNAAFEGKPASQEAQVVMGHESAGIVRQVGEGVTNLRPGDRVSLEPMMPCFRCQDCIRGRHNLCKQGKTVSMIGSPDGFLTQWTTVPFRNALKLPDELDWDEAACLQPLAVAVHSCRRAGIGPHQSVAIFGVGPIGLFIGIVAKAYGASTIIGFDISETRLDMARRSGFTHTFASQRTPADIDATTFARTEASRVLKEASLDPLGVDVVVEASAAASAMLHGVALVRAGGTYLQVGLPQGMTPFPIRQMTVKELEVKGIVKYSLGSFEAAIDLIQRKVVDLKPFVTKRVPLTKTGEALEGLKDATEIKVVIYNNLQ